MAWRDEMRPASFRGVGFFVEVADLDQDLFADEHVFPQRDDPTAAVRVENLGLGPRRYQIRAFVHGADYMERRDALEEALREPGPGRLVHPWRGERTVSIIGPIKTRESRKSGGVAEITFRCVDVSEAGLRSEADAGAIADRDLDAFLEDTAADFDAAVAEASVPSAYGSQVTDGWEGVTDAIEEAHRKVSNALGVVDDYTERVEAFADDLADFASAPGAAVDALLGALEAVAELPGEVFGAAAASLDSILGAGEAVRRAFGELLEWGSDADPIPTITPSAVEADRLRRATFRAIRQGAFAASAKALLAVPFASRSRALTVRANLAEDADGLLLDDDGPGGDELAAAASYASLMAARVSTLRHLATVAAEAPETVTFTPSATAPALVIAHDLYGDAERESEIVIRNDPPHPGQIPAGTELEVRRG